LNLLLPNEALGELSGENLGGRDEVAKAEAKPVARALITFVYI
jgi:hypothetical protein